MTRTGQDVSAEPLRAHRLFQTQDIDLARQFVTQKFCDHDLVPTSSHHCFDTRHNHVAGQMLSLNYLKYSSEVSINPGELDRFYLIQVPIHGQATVTNGSKEVDVSINTASVLNPMQNTQMTWFEGCEKLLLQIDKAALQTSAEALVGMPLGQPVVFDPKVDMALPATSAWCHTLKDAVKVAQNGGAFGDSAFRHQAMLEENLIFGFLSCQKSTISHFFVNDEKALSSSQLRRAKTYMLENLAEPITLSDLAYQAGCSLRSLQCGFKKSYGCSPMQYLQKQRLGYAHFLLQSLPPDHLVSSVAYDCGFTHLGRFSIAYRKAFGQSPKKTLGR
ncbi:helix-turn-helix domain-containing protein [Parasedimentitalea huanghaiensis]|uniref:AraC-like ligand-binding domain-containing protein n=1 Tax=Parasedimentitalea huanghaiensis TaxID=2682100 RepID=UPI0012ED4E24|nr:AraC family transcriptional regulator [Zongyanglinia huanghaiensis]